MCHKSEYPNSFVSLKHDDVVIDEYNDDKISAYFEKRKKLTLESEDYQQTLQFMDNLRFLQIGKKCQANQTYLVEPGISEGNVGSQRKYNHNISNEMVRRRIPDTSDTPLSTLAIPSNPIGQSNVYLIQRCLIDGLKMVMIEGSRLKIRERLKALDPSTPHYKRRPPHRELDM
ncbi:hypothetical protein Tco_1057058 [Tanacetum coccineum]|uniref:Uncharacterized protein n=1 Tax=Tanacetum coccineum TaxID=301880 RepID=A0ABQ5H4C7_9ASTR